MSIRIQIHAPAGSARITASGARFGRASCYSSDIPRCQIVQFTDHAIEVRDTTPDENGAPGQFGLNIELIYDPLSSVSITGQTNGSASLGVEKDGVYKALGPNQTETVLHSWLGLTQAIEATK